jgi:hypothetical protein
MQDPDDERNARLNARKMRRMSRLAAEAVGSRPPSASPSRRLLLPRQRPPLRWGVPPAPRSPLAVFESGARSRHRRCLGQSFAQAGARMAEFFEFALDPAWPTGGPVRLEATAFALSSGAFPQWGARWGRAGVEGGTSGALRPVSGPAFDSEQRCCVGVNVGDSPWYLQVGAVAPQGAPSRFARRRIPPGGGCYVSGDKVATARWERNAQAQATPGVLLEVRSFIYPGPEATP